MNVKQNFGKDPDGEKNIIFYMFPEDAVWHSNYYRLPRDFCVFFQLEVKDESKW